MHVVLTTTPPGPLPMVRPHVNTAAPRFNSKRQRFWICGPCPWWIDVQYSHFKPSGHLRQTSTQRHGIHIHSTTVPPVPTASSASDAWRSVHAHGVLRRAYYTQCSCRPRTDTTGTCRNHRQCTQADSGTTARACVHCRTTGSAHRPRHNLGVITSPAPWQRWHHGHDAMWP